MTLTERFFYTALLYGCHRQRVALEWTEKAYLTCIRYESENNWPLKHKRFHIKKSITKQTLTCPKSAATNTQKQSKRICFYVFAAKVGKAFVYSELYMFYIKISIKGKRTKMKESSPFSLFLSLSKHKFLEIVMFMTQQFLWCIDRELSLFSISCFKNFLNQC